MAAVTAWRKNYKSWRKLWRKRALRQTTTWTDTAASWSKYTSWKRPMKASWTSSSRWAPRQRHPRAGGPWGLRRVTWRIISQWKTLKALQQERDREQRMTPPAKHRKPCTVSPRDWKLRLPHLKPHKMMRITDQRVCLNLFRKVRGYHNLLYVLMAQPSHSIPSCAQSNFQNQRNNWSHWMLFFTHLHHFFCTGFADIPIGEMSPFIIRRTAVQRCSPRLAAQTTAAQQSSVLAEHPVQISKRTAEGRKSNTVSRTTCVCSCNHNNLHGKWW